MKRRHKAGKWRNSGCSLNILTDDEAHEIHLSTLELLKDTGVFVENDEALAIFDGGGCRVDGKHKVVKFPNWVVEDAIQSRVRLRNFFDLRNDMLSPGIRGIGIHQTAMIPSREAAAAAASGDVAWKILLGILVPEFE